MNDVPGTRLEEGEHVHGRLLHRITKKGVKSRGCETSQAAQLLPPTRPSTQEGRAGQASTGRLTTSL
jgi:hypothetical protein